LNEFAPPGQLRRWVLTVNLGNMKLRSRTKNPLLKRARKGFRGYPVATVAFYGPDDRRATKVAVGIVTREGAEPDFLERWYAEDGDLRSNEETTAQIRVFLSEHNVVSVAAVDRIIGCPHEEGIDYPEGTACPQCSFWRGRDRFTGDMVH
jgi:hypothetical protein